MQTDDNGDDFSPQDLAALRKAKDILEHPALTAKLADLVGTPIEKVLDLLPKGGKKKVGEVTTAALSKCVKLSIKTLDIEDVGVESSDWWHKLGVACTGTAGGAFGLIALPLELPVTTTIMFRSICDIARSEGHDLGSIAVQLQCLSVFALGGPSKADDAADTGYFVVRAAMAAEITQAAEALAKGAASAAESGIVRLITAIASRFSVQVSEQVAAKIVPGIGAITGAAVNLLFIDYFQDIARAHFTVLRLEEKYGSSMVREMYKRL